MEEKFLDNTDWDNLGICQWLKYMYPEHYRNEFAKEHIEVYRMLLELYDPRYVNKQHRLRELIAFRGFSKTKIIFGIVSYLAAHNGMEMKIKSYDGTIHTVTIKERNMIIFSETGGMSEEFVVNIRDEFSVNERLKYFYHYTIQDAKEEDTGQWTRRAFKINGTFIIGLGAGQQARGKIRGAYRPTCHAKGSLVWHNNILTKIEETDWEKIEQQEEVLEIKLNGIPVNESVTLDHQYWAIKRKTIRDKYGNHIYSFSEPSWVEARDLTKEHYIGTPIDNSIIEIPKFKRFTNKGKKIIRNSKGQVIRTIIDKEKDYEYITPEVYYNKEFWWMLGLWFGDGTVTKTTLSFACAKKYPKTIERLKNVIALLNRKFYVHDQENHVDISFGDTLLARYLKTLKHGNSIKRIPLWIQQGEEKLVREFIKGYIDSDGWVDVENNQIRITSINYETLLNVSYMLARLGIPSSIRIGASPRIEYFNVGGKSYTSFSKQKYDIMFNQNCEWIHPEIKNPKRINAKAIFIENNFIWRRVANCEYVGERTVVKVNLPEGESKNNMEPIGNTYLTPFGLSHNCVFHDDIYSENNVLTEDSRKKTKNWFYNAANNSVDDILGKIFLVGTIVHDDTVLIECERSKVWRTSKYYPMPLLKFKEFTKKYLKVDLDIDKCELPFEDIEDEFERIAKQIKFFKELDNDPYWEVTWKDRIGLYLLSTKYKEAVENQSIRGFYQEYFHEISPSELRKFNPAYFQSIKNYEIISKYGYQWFICDELYKEPQVINIELGLDIAGDSKEGDNTVLTAVGMLSNGKLIVLEQRVGKFSMRDNITEDNFAYGRNDRILTATDNVLKKGYIDELFRMYLKYSPRIIKIGQGGGSEGTIINEARRVFNANGCYVNIVPRAQTTKDGKKKERITETLLPYYETMSVFHTNGLEMLEYELEYLGKAKRDDCPDSLECAVFNIWRPAAIEYKQFTETKPLKRPIWGYPSTQEGNWRQDWRN
jgi:hypothetical protein